MDSHTIWSSPTRPAAGTSFDDLSLRDVRDIMTRLPLDAELERPARSIVDRWLADPDHATPMHDLQQLIESVRQIPRSDNRVIKMNVIVRTLGEPTVLANVLDMLRHAAHRDGTKEQELSETSQGGSMHAIYGWCGQTSLVHSLDHAVDATTVPEDGLQRRLRYRLPTWALSLHIWQPNPNAKGFPTGKAPEPGVLVEPPHTHPFDFVSRVVTGTMYQSTYLPHGGVQAKANDRRPGRYDGVMLDHVDGVWPTHEHRIPTAIETIDRIELRSGDSYFMPCNRIHDVEVVRSVAVTTPAITLFMPSEGVVMPHAYMSEEMVDFHEAHPDYVNTTARPLPPEAWHAKLEAVSRYLRGDSSTLNLDQIVKYDGEYGFFHE